VVGGRPSGQPPHPCLQQKISPQSPKIIG